jgi:hypothetical protein
MFEGKKTSSLSRCLYKGSKTDPRHSQEERAMPRLSKARKATADAGPAAAPAAPAPKKTDAKISDDFAELLRFAAEARKKKKTDAATVIQGAFKRRGRPKKNP